jgi:inward rectifier potassium channel
MALRRQRRRHDRTSPRDPVRLGGRPVAVRDLYHAMLTVSWPTLCCGLALLYILCNLVFAVLYLIQPGSIANAAPGSLLDTFFFSVETMSTIGYGNMVPATLYANLLMTLEAMLGIAVFALAAGIVFARFSRPTARVLFSEVAVVTPFDGVPTLMFRCANERRNRILEAEVRVYFAREETSAEGTTMRRTYDLALVRSRNPLFTLSWTVMHPIDARSPLYGIDPDFLASWDAGIVITLTGTDETLSQPVIARHSYRADQILWGRKFVDILDQLEDGQRVVDYRRFHDTEEAQA